MSNEPQKPYQPYAPANEQGNNDIRENIGANAMQPAPLNGWGEQNFEENTFDRRRK